MLGDKLIFLRKSRGWTQEEISKKIGVHRGTYSNYETNKREPDYKTLKKLADIYEVTTDYLLGREKNEAVDIKEALTNKKATWGGKELTPEQREILTEFFAMIRDRVKEGKKVNEEKKADDDSTGEKKVIESIKLLA